MEHYDSLPKIILQVSFFCCKMFSEINVKHIKIPTLISPQALITNTHKTHYEGKLYSTLTVFSFLKTNW